ncbi:MULTISPECIES: hypothetical protein [Enterobacteriaceae]|uniref:hypothetical protein n=1 Tax=Enterobacteriaceae TaxID=543 RepID=UPI0007CD34AD|nr:MULTISPECIES: hypothetical protein [Klebsiella]DAI96768.1 MAG TPA: Putative transcriptional regulator, YggD, Mannitol operon repressor.5A [Caudoviricetes sp.]HBT2836160.1 hypothetical protein [Klebsiella pneumoniae]EKV5142832.1 hypothetical protein [Klebsiella michiganensis]MBA4427265.1 hypothetical protein [Klebsiella michiganensis]MCW9534571.1 hypothetical protein [Klebsiella oxytoca]
MDKAHFSTLLRMKEMNMRFVSLTFHTDQLSAVLVIHMVCEKILETWIEASSHNKNFFNNSVSLTFNNKLIIAKNFSFPNECFQFMKKLNAIRNKFAHQIDKTEMTEEEINSLYNSLSEFIAREPEFDPKTSSIESRKKRYKYTDNNNIKLLLLFTAMYLSVMYFAGLRELYIPLGEKP